MDLNEIETKIVKKCRISLPQEKCEEAQWIKVFKINVKELKRRVAQELSEHIETVITPFELEPIIKNGYSNKLVKEYLQDNRQKFRDHPEK